jgi:hypothetical protein
VTLEVLVCPDDVGGAAVVDVLVTVSDLAERIPVMGEFFTDVGRHRFQVSKPPRNVAPEEPTHPGSTDAMLAFATE